MIPESLPDIKDSDVISGSFYKSFIEAYKKHDDGIKDHFKKLYAKINRLTKENKILKQHNSELQKQFDNLCTFPNEKDQRYKEVKRLNGILSKRLYEARVELELLKNE